MPRARPRPVRCAPRRRRSRIATSTRSFTRNRTPASPQLRARTAARGSKPSSESSGARSWTAVAPPSTAAVAISPCARPETSVPVVTTYRSSARGPTLAIAASAGIARFRSCGSRGGPRLSARPQPELPEWSASGYPRHTVCRRARATASSRRTFFQSLAFVLSNTSVDDLEQAQREQDDHRPAGCIGRRREREREERRQLRRDRPRCVHPGATGRRRAQVRRVVGLQPGQRRRRDRRRSSGGTGSPRVVPRRSAWRSGARPSTPAPPRRKATPTAVRASDEVSIAKRTAAQAATTPTRDQARPTARSRARSAPGEGTARRTPSRRCGPPGPRAARSARRRA